jgi:tripartite-type tricarboxylate transporter receptor subunit TctC
LEASLKQSIIIESRPGATGNVGSAYVSKAAPDGYTLLTQATIIGAYPHIFSHLQYDPLKDLAVVGGMGESANAFVVNADSNIKSLGELIQKAKESPGGVHYGSSGVGAPSHVVVELVGKINGVKFAHVPYKGAAPAMNDLLGGFVDFTCITVSPALSLIREGKLRALAVTTDKRSPALPDVPTVKELGLGNIDEALRYAVFAPSGTPPQFMERLSQTVRSALAEPEVREAYRRAGYEVMTNTPEEISAQIKAQYDGWGPIIKDLNLNLD